MLGSGCGGCVERGAWNRRVRHRQRRGVRFRQRAYELSRRSPKTTRLPMLLAEPPLGQILEVRSAALGELGQAEGRLEPQV